MTRPSQIRLILSLSKDEACMALRRTDMPGAASFDRLRMRPFVRTLMPGLSKQATAA
jgi:hypothetical protein